MECQFSPYYGYPAFEVIEEEKGNISSNAAIPPDNDAQDALTLVHLPVEILESQLLAKLPTKVLLKCRFISKFFREVIDIVTIIRHVERLISLRLIKKLMGAPKSTPPLFLNLPSSLSAFLCNANSIEQANVFNHCKTVTQFKNVIEVLPDNLRSLSLFIREARQKNQKSRLQRIFTERHHQALTLLVDKIKNLDLLTEFSLAGVISSFNNKSLEFLISNLSHVKMLRLVINPDSSISYPDLSSILKHRQNLKILHLKLSSKIFVLNPILPLFSFLLHLEELYVSSHDPNNLVDLVLKKGKNETDFIELHKGKFKSLKILSLNNFKLSNQVIETTHNSLWEILCEMENLTNFIVEYCFTSDQPKYRGRCQKFKYSYFSIDYSMSFKGEVGLTAEKVQDNQEKLMAISKKRKLV